MTAIGAVRTLKYEGVVVESDNIWMKKDSIFNATPAFSFLVNTVGGERFETRAFYKKLKVFSLERMVKHTNGTLIGFMRSFRMRMVLIQRYGWRNLMLTQASLTSGY